MRAIILAAGRGMRLQQAADRQIPKALLRFDGLTLLERHLRLLRNAGVHESRAGARLASRVDRGGARPARLAATARDRAE
jgi:CTP:molybdopterin cytidylyltransferase MocA